MKLGFLALRNGADTALILSRPTGEHERAGTPYTGVPAREAVRWCCSLRRGQTAGAGYVGYSTPETCWTTRMTWHE